MPYIRQGDRRFVEEFGPRGPGELNYLITKLCVQYIEEGGGLTYARGNEVIGVLECAKQEFYRRALAPYEDAKATANGDVYQ